MRAAFLGLIFLLSGFFVLATAGVSGGATADVDGPPGAKPDCFGLSCAQPGSKHYVPEASMQNVTKLESGLEGLGRKPKAGFYEYTTDLSTDSRAVAYFVPRGEIDFAPESVRELPTVRATMSSFSRFPAVIFNEGTVAFGETYADQAESASIAPKAQRRATKKAGKGPRAGKNGKKAGNKDKGPRAGASANINDCPTQAHFCLFTCKNQNNTNSGCAHFLVLKGSTYINSGWVNLSSLGTGAFNYNNTIRSMATSRDKDSGLAEKHNGNGQYYCADSHSKDNDLDNNFNGNEWPSSFRMHSDDTHCPNAPHWP